MSALVMQMHYHPPPAGLVPHHIPHGMHAPRPYAPPPGHYLYPPPAAGYVGAPYGYAPPPPRPGFIPAHAHAAPPPVAGSPYGAVMYGSPHAPSPAPPVHHLHAPPVHAHTAGCSATTAPPQVFGVPQEALDFAAEKPEAYKAFERMAVQTDDDGTRITLANEMCQDRHIPDFLLCLQCWLPRTLGDVRLTGRPWRLKCLDISRNKLADASIISVMTALRQLDVRVDYLRLAGNEVDVPGLAAVTDYLWNSTEAVKELDLSDNKIYADPLAGPRPGSDAVSGLLRCFYNHASYPCIQDRGNGSLQVIPLTLRMGGNLVQHPKTLLKDILSKGGKNHVRISPDANPYPQPASQEYLSVCLPDFLTQQKASRPAPVDAVPPQGPPQTFARPAAGRSRSRRRRRRPEASPAAEEPVRSERKVQLLSAAAADASGKSRKRNSEGGSERSASPPPANKPEKPEKERRRRRESAEPAPATQDTAAAEKPNVDAVWCQPGVMPPEKQEKLQKAVGARLKDMEHLQTDEPTRDMLSEFVVCMVVARKVADEIIGELQQFMGPAEAGDLVEWLRKRIVKEAATPAQAAEDPPPSEEKESNGTKEKKKKEKKDKDKGKEKEPEKEEKRSRRRMKE